jgi:hypothetical protein
MMIEASGRSALILVTGLFVCFACPSQAATGADNATADSKSENAPGAPVALHKNLRHGWRHGKHHAQGKSPRVGLNTVGHKKATASDADADNSEASSDLPPKIANANAQLPWPSAAGGTAGAIAAQANDPLQAAAQSPADAKADNETLVVAADQLNDVDRALHAANPPAAPTVIASADPPAAPVTASSQENSTWDRTSLIGKIFIGFGALLTMASAARMFMA